MRATPSRRSEPRLGQQTRYGNVTIISAVAQPVTAGITSELPSERHISSNLGRTHPQVATRPPPGRSAYATAKSAQAGLARAWARELTPLGITVNTVALGLIPVQRHASVPDDARQAYLASVLPRLRGRRVITSQRILIDGGRELSR